MNKPRGFDDKVHLSTRSATFESWQRSLDGSVISKESDLDDGVFTAAAFITVIVRCFENVKVKVRSAMGCCCQLG